MPEKLRLRLQHFAEGGTQDPEPNNDPEPKNDPEPNDTGKGEGEKTFTQEDVDQIIKDRVAREKKSKEDAVKEAEKLAKMNKDQKAE